MGPVLAHGRGARTCTEGGPYLHTTSMCIVLFCAQGIPMLFLNGSDRIPVGFPCGALAILIGDPKDFHWIPHWISELVPLVCK